MKFKSEPKTERVDIYYEKCSHGSERASFNEQRDQSDKKWACAGQFIELGW